MAKKPVSSFTNLSVEEIAERVEHDMRHEARVWRRANPKSRAIETAATSAAAMYLSKHHDLYFRESKEEMKAAHQQWMRLMQEWFVSTLKKASVPESEVC